MTQDLLFLKCGCIWCVNDGLGSLGVLAIELDLVLVDLLWMRDGALEVDLGLVCELSTSEGASCVCVLHWGLEEVALCEWVAEDTVRAEFASLVGRECLGSFDSV